MRKRASRKTIAAWLPLAAIVASDAGRSPCDGQTRQLPNSATRTDTYGNARGVHIPRRAVGNFANDTQRMQLRGFQSEGRRALYRGGDRPFALPSDRTVHRPLARSISSTDYWESKRAFTQYGILGIKRPSRAPASPADLLGRRAALLRATAITAPVRHSLLLRGTALPQAGPVVPGPAPTFAGESSLPPVTLGVSLQAQLTESGVGLMAKGWAYFEEGEYRRAVHAFESATMLAPGEAEPRIAEIFCYLSLGALRTASTLLEHLTRQDDILFADSLDVTAHYSAQGELRQLRIQCRLFSQGSQSVARGAAIYPFFLWYVGDRQEALTEAAVVAREHPNSVFGQWTALMGSALE